MFCFLVGKPIWKFLLFYVIICLRETSMRPESIIHHLIPCLKRVIMLHMLTTIWITPYINIKLRSLLFEPLPISTLNSTFPLTLNSIFGLKSISQYRWSLTLTIVLILQHLQFMLWYLIPPSNLQMDYFKILFAIILTPHTNSFFNSFLSGYAQLYIQVRSIFYMEHHYLAIHYTLKHNLSSYITKFSVTTVQTKNYTANDTNNYKTLYNYNC